METLKTILNAIGIAAFIVILFFCARYCASNFDDILNGTLFSRVTVSSQQDAAMKIDGYIKSGQDMSICGKLEAEKGLQGYSTHQAFADCISSYAETQENSPACYTAGMTDSDSDVCIEGVSAAAKVH